MSDASTALLAAAHDYRARGWRVIALHNVGPDGVTCSCNKGANCSSKGKHPVDMGWQKNAAPSAPDIEATWEKRPKANVGIATGKESGFWVLDIDPKSGGFEAMNALVAEHGNLPPTRIHQTGSGGYHYLFDLPDFELRNTSGKIGKGIDTRADGGQIVAPPSRTDIGDYIVFVDAPLAQAPDWLLEMARKEEVDHEIVTAADLPRPEDIDPGEWQRLNKYAESAIESERQRLRNLAIKGWDGEPWNHTTFEVSCALVELANSPWNSYSLGQAQNDVMTLTPRDTQGFDDHTVAKTWHSARERVGDKARPMPAKRTAPAEDPLFEGVRDLHPTGGDGDPAAPVTGHRGPWLFDDKNNFLARAAAEAVIDLGPVGFGRDRDFWEYRTGVWHSNRDIIEDRLASLTDDRYRPAYLSAAKPHVRMRAVPITGSPLSQYMNFVNGMLDWQTGEMVPHDPAFGSTIQFPLEYRPEAECPTFDRFLADILHPDYVALAWEMLGYLMYSGNKFQTAFLFYGGGQNGKGTLIRVIESILGHENIAHESLDQLNKSTFSAINLYGKIANIAGDIDATYQESTANFKKITGEDTIGAERKFGDRFDFENWAVPLFSANKIPGSADVTEGYLRRWIVLHFHKTITKEQRVLGLSDLLASEIEGIAAKAVRALRVLMERGRFDPTGEALRGKEEFALAIDQVRQWLASGEVLEAPEARTKAADLYRAYHSWATQTGQRPLREFEFSKRLADIGYAHEGSVHIGLTASLRVPTSEEFFS